MENFEEEIGVHGGDKKGRHGSSLSEMLRSVFAHKTRTVSPCGSYRPLSLKWCEDDELLTEKELDRRLEADYQRNMKRLQRGEEVSAVPWWYCR